MRHTKEQAVRAGARLLLRMHGRGWMLRVWGTIGWHYAVENKHVSVSPITVTQGDRQSTRFVAMLRPHYTYYGNSPTGKDPNKIAIQAVKLAEAHAETASEFARGARDSLGGESARADTHMINND